LRKVRAFTLVELLVVIAITSVILTLLIIPIVQSFNFTRNAQGVADGQERARRLIERITNEIANSPGVRDNAGFRGQICLVVPDMNGTNISLLADYAKLDILVPLQGDPANRGASGAYINPYTGGEDPTLEHSIGQPVFPVAPGASVVRYYISLKRPLAGNGLDPNAYYNPHIDYLRNGNVRWQALPGQEDNLYVIRRAEVTPMRWNANLNRFEVNTNFFEDDGTGRPIMDDPYFMTQDPPGLPPLAPAARQAKANRMKAWLNKSDIVTEFYRFDAIQPLINKQNRTLLSLGTTPRINTLIQFRPASVSNEPATGSSTLRLGTEMEGAASVTTDILLTKNPAWSTTVIRVYPVGYDAQDVNNNEYFVTRLDPRAGQYSHRIYKYDPDLDTDADDRNGEDNPNDDIEVFDILAYEDQIRQGRMYPFRRGIEASHGRSGWLGNAAIRAKFMPFIPSSSQGKLTTSIPIEYMGEDDPTGTVLPRPDKNLPSLMTGAETTPSTDPTPAGNFYDPVYQSNINGHFNKVWADHPELRAPGQTHRFIYLPVVPMADGTYSPLDPDPTIGWDQARIVPGSEIITGPDQNPGPTYGQPTKYTRTTGNPGPNQYRINYVDLPEPDYALLGYPAPPAAYDPQNFVSAVIQPRYKAGYIQLNSNPNVPLPGTQPIFVSYRFQLNQPGVAVSVDYDTRSQIEVLLTIRNYPQSTIPTPAMITVKGSAPIRNLSR
jgi:prepilin-type N-terminal cleavage/methylation domain-containing protein